MDASPFATLPGELRNKIWQKIVIAPGHINVSKKTGTEEPSLLATCRQIRSEASGIY